MIAFGKARFHGVFAPNSRHRVTITPSLRNKTKQALPTGQEKTRATLKVIANIDKSAGKPIFTANAVPQGVDTRMCLMNSIGDSKDTQSPEYKK